MDAGGVDRSHCPSVESAERQLFDLAIIVLAQVLPIPRSLLDAVTRSTSSSPRYASAHSSAPDAPSTRNDAGYWLSPLADPLAAIAIALGIIRRGRQTWRGRTYS